MVLYIGDLMCRVIPDLEGLKYVTPYYFSNGADIFASGEVQWGMAAAALVVMVLSVVAAAVVYQKKDLAS